MTACRSGCPTKDHPSWGECARQSGIQLGDVKGAGGTAAKDLRLSSYHDARRAGIQPPSTKLADVRRAVAVSDRTGVAFDAAAA